MEEISRSVILNAQKNGINQLFLEDPLLFSKTILKGRLKQFKAANAFTIPLVFFDRAIPDIVAYLDYNGNTYTNTFTIPCTNFKYDAVFILKPWQAIYTIDNERYESFEQAKRIYKNILNTYKKYNYTPIDVPFGSVKERTSFILNTLQ